MPQTEMPIFTRTFDLLAYHAGLQEHEAVRASIRGWVNHVRYANSVGLRKALLCRTVLRPASRSAARPGPGPTPVRQAG